MTLFLDIGQGTGLASASGVRPFLPPILAASLGRADLGVNFSGGDFAFLESIAFIAVLAVLAGVAYLRELPLPLLAALAVAIGALLFAGSLTEGGREGWIGLPLGAACAVLAWYVSARFFSRARARLGPKEGGLLDVYGDLAALSLALVSVVIPPFAFVALAVFVVLLLRGRAAEERKYEGLRILR